MQKCNSYLFNLKIVKFRQEFFENKTFDQVFLVKDIGFVFLTDIKHNQIQANKIDRHQQQIDPAYIIFIHNCNIPIRQTRYSK